MEENNKNTKNNHSEINLENQKDKKTDKKILYDKISDVRKLKPK